MTTSATIGRATAVGQLVVAATLTAAFATLTIAAPPAQAVATAAPLNVVVIVTDDQVEGTMDAMPITRDLIRDQGVTLKDGIIPTSTCCPSRTTLLTGQYSRTTGVYRNLGPNGGWSAFHVGGSEDRTLAVALNDQGYRTGLFGKYLNGFALADPGYVPPGWDSFHTIYDPSSKPALAAGAYYNYELRGTDQTESFGQDPTDYSTDVIAAKSVSFIESTPADQPLFLYFAPTGPHSPFVHAPRHEGLWHREPVGPAVKQLTTNAPSFLPQQLVNPARMSKHLRDQHLALMAVDEAVGRIVDALGARADNTLFVYMSDNGLQLGEHGLVNKYSPYSGSTDVPMFLRWDGEITPGSTFRGIITNADLAATIADATGISLVNPDGISFFSSQRPDGAVLEATADRNHPAYCGWRTARYLYVSYANGEEELYDYRQDPYELINQAEQPDYTDIQAGMRRQAVTGCTPTPPGFNWSSP
ncbi:MAG: sulfatase [Actinomycetia bacterium]|nr:sulfatase [Actinomycetes bacterium]